MPIRTAADAFGLTKRIHDTRVTEVAKLLIEFASLPTPQALALARRIVDYCEGKR